MRSIFFQMFTGMLVSVSVVVVVLGVIFVTGLDHSIAGWNVQRDQQLQNLMLPVLARLHHRTGSLTENEVQKALSPFLSRNIYVYLSDDLGRPLLLFAQGERVPTGNRAALRRELRDLRPRLTAPAPIIDDGHVIGRLYTGTFGFRNDLVNEIFVKNLFATLLAGIAVSICLALGVGYILSRHVSRQAASLSKAIGAVASGRRDVAFRNDGASELESIATSARELQERLAHIERLRRESTQNIAHDLKTPITAPDNRHQDSGRGDDGRNHQPHASSPPLTHGGGRTHRASRQ